MDSRGTSDRLVPELPLDKAPAREQDYSSCYQGLKPQALSGCMVLVGLVICCHWAQGAWPALRIF
jgi:hypothetical protein